MNHKKNSFLLEFSKWTNSVHEYGAGYWIVYIYLQDDEWPNFPQILLFLFFDRIIIHTFEP